MTRKRSATPTDHAAASKKLHVDSHATMIDVIVSRDRSDDTSLIKSPEIKHPPTHHFNARYRIQRSIALIAAHDGFESATTQALESFTELAETYLESMIQEVKRLALASRREQPIPSDFETMLRRYNLPMLLLNPHIKNPMSINPAPTFFWGAEENTITNFKPLPLLGKELSGEPDKDAKQYIPNSFPDFPSRHTYKFTPQDNTRAHDSQKIREAAALNAQQGEEALRRLVRASKMRKQKEAKSMVERDYQGKERFRLWESTMRRFMGSNSRAHVTGEVEIADHSMIVNGDAAFSRKDVSRLGQRSTAMSSKNL